MSIIGWNCLDVSLEIMSKDAKEDKVTQIKNKLEVWHESKETNHNHYKESYYTNPCFLDLSKVYGFKPCIFVHPNFLRYDKGHNLKI
jgi:hypothetical protein